MLVTAGLVAVLQITVCPDGTDPQITHDYGQGTSYSDCDDMTYADEASPTDEELCMPAQDGYPCCMYTRMDGPYLGHACYPWDSDWWNPNDLVCSSTRVNDGDVSLLKCLGSVASCPSGYHLAWYWEDGAKEVNVYVNVTFCMADDDPYGKYLTYADESQDLCRAATPETQCCSAVKQTESSDNTAYSNAIQCWAKQNTTNLVDTIDSVCTDSQLPDGATCAGIIKEYEARLNCKSSLVEETIIDEDTTIYAVDCSGTTSAASAFGTAAATAAGIAAVAVALALS